MYRRPPGKHEMIVRAPCTAARPGRSQCSSRASCMRHTFPARGHPRLSFDAHAVPLHFPQAASHETHRPRSGRTRPRHAPCGRLAARRAHLPKATCKHVTTVPALQPAACAAIREPVTAMTTTREPATKTAIGAKKDAALIDRSHGSPCSGVSRRFARADPETTTGAAPRDAVGIEPDRRAPLSLVTLPCFFWSAQGI